MKRLIMLLPLILLLISCDARSQKKPEVRKVNLMPPKGRAIAAFAEGCFWCSEEIFDAVAGVDSAVSGYAGGHSPNPTYDRVNTETTGHAESVLVYYNPAIVSYQELLKIFFASHDPTTLNQQGPDRGSSYRSIIFYRSAAEKAQAEQAIREASKSARFKKPLVTELKPLNAFYRAENYHQNYIRYNPENPYVRSVSKPRFEQFKKTYKGRLKKAE